MRPLHLDGAIVHLLRATLPLSVLVIAGGAHSEARKTAIAPNSQMLFKCKTDYLFLLPRFSDQKADEQSYPLLGRRDSKGEILLSVDSKTHALTLSLQLGDRPLRKYVLRKVEQGSSGGSGAGGRADTAIRGRSAGKVFTLFAEYENFSDEHAQLMIEGRTTSLITCANGHYDTSVAEGVGRYGAGVYTLSADGLAQKMKKLPAEPDIEGSKVIVYSSSESD